MEDNKIKKMISNVDYNHYVTLEKLCVCSSFMLNIANYAMLNNNPYFGIATFFVFSTSVLGALTNMKQNTREYTKLKEIYNILQSNFSVLLNRYECDDPIKIYSIFKNSLHFGYLSPNCKFTYSEKVVLNDMNFWGVSILGGEGVCRHTASFLNDLLIYNNFDSYRLEVATFKKDDFNKNFFRRYSPDHLITMANHNNKTYFLDPTNRMVFENYDSSTKILSSKNCLESLYVTKQDILYRSSKSRENIHSLLKQECPSLEEVNSILTKFDKIFVDSIIEINNFYNENKDLYKETNYLIRKIKKTQS